MHMKRADLFIEAVRASQDVPADVRSHPGDAWDIEESYIDASYIQFLDEQIRLSPRGPEWTERLKKRRAALLPFCGVSLLRGMIRVGDTGFVVRVHPVARSVIYCEEYEYEHAA